MSREKLPCLKTTTIHVLKHVFVHEVSVQKAHRILHGVIYEAWLELDDVIFESKESQQRNRGTYEQLVNEPARLGSQLAQLAENRVSGSQGITNADTGRTARWSSWLPKAGLRRTCASATLRVVQRRILQNINCKRRLNA